MSFPHNAAPPSEGFQLIPDGTYDFQITDVKEKKTSAGYPMVNVECEIKNNAELNGQRIFHNVTFMPPEKSGSGISTHFLKVIGQPWEGAIEVDPLNWVGESFRAKVGTREYEIKKEGPNKGKVAKANELKDIKTLEDTILF